MYLRKAVEPFASSRVAILALVALFGLALWPNMVTTFNLASQQADDVQGGVEHGLRTMLIMAMVEMPFVLTCTAAVYWTFRGRVELAEHS